MRTVLAFEFALQTWSADAPRFRGSKPMQHSGFEEWRGGRIIPKDNPGGVIDQLEEAAPGTAAIFRSPMWVLLRGEQATVERLEKCLADGEMHKLGAEYRDLAKYEDVLLRVEIASRIQKVAVFDALLGSGKDSIATIGLPRVVAPFANDFARLCRDAFEKWDEALAVLQTISRRADVTPVSADPLSSAEIEATASRSDLPLTPNGHEEPRPSPLSWIADLTRKDSLIAIVALLPSARFPELFPVSFVILALNLAGLFSPSVFDWPGHKSSAGDRK